jgi:hypothetical protein
VLEHISDPFAAVPSLHMAWATCVVVGLWPLAGGLRHRAVARLALSGYPALTWATVVVTGIHFLLDGAAGVAVVAGVAGLRSGVAAVRRGGRWILTHRPDQDRVSGQRASRPSRAAAAAIATTAALASTTRSSGSRAAVPVSKPRRAFTS